jgi:hypothetical protein
VIFLSVGVNEMADVPDNRQARPQLMHSELDERRKRWTLPDHVRLQKGSLLERYRRMVGPAVNGSILE